MDQVWNETSFGWVATNPLVLAGKTGPERHPYLR